MPRKSDLLIVPERIGVITASAGMGLASGSSAIVTAGGPQSLESLPASLLPS